MFDQKVKSLESEYIMDADLVMGIREIIKHILLEFKFDSPIKVELGQIIVEIIDFSGLYGLVMNYFN